MNHGDLVNKTETKNVLLCTDNFNVHQVNNLGKSGFGKERLR